MGEYLAEYPELYIRWLYFRIYYRLTLFSKVLKLFHTSTNDVSSSRYILTIRWYHPIILAIMCVVLSHCGFNLLDLTTDVEHFFISLQTMPIAFLIKCLFPFLIYTHMFPLPFIFPLFVEEIRLTCKGFHCLNFADCLSVMFTDHFLLCLVFSLAN